MFEYLCELSGRQHFPPTEYAVLRQKRTQQKGSIANEKPMQPQLEDPSGGAGRRRGWREQVLFVKIARRHPLTDPFAQAARVSWMSLLRAQSECLQLVSQLPRKKMDPDSVLESPAVIGMGKKQLVIKLHGSKRIAGGSRMARRRICHQYPKGSLKIHAPQMFCHVCSLWDDAMRRVRKGGGIVPRNHKNRFREQAVKYGAPIRLGKGRSLGGPQYSRRSLRGRF